MQHKHLFKIYSLSSLLFVCGFLIGFFLLFFMNRIFQVQHIYLIGGTSEEKVAITNMLKGTSTLLTSASQMSQTVSGQFPIFMIKDIHIQWPSTVSLIIEKRKSLAYLISDNGYFTLSKDGIILAKERSELIPSPSIRFYQTVHHLEYQKGQSIGFKAIKRALLFISLLEDVGFNTETVAIDSVDMIACKTKGFEVVFSQSRLVDLQSHELRQISRQIKAGALRIERLDLRFEKPVVQLPQK